MEELQVLIEPMRVEICSATKSLRGHEEIRSMILRVSESKQDSAAFE